MVILICINNSTNMQTASDFPHGLWGEDLTGQNDNFAFPASDILFLCREHHSLSFSSVISPGLDCKGEKRKTSTELTGRLQLDEHCEKTNQFDVNPLPPQICWSIQIELFSTGLRNKPLLDQERHQHQSEFRLQPCFQSNLTKPRVDLQVNSDSIILTSFQRWSHITSLEDVNHLSNYKHLQQSGVLISQFNLVSGFFLSLHGP